MRAGRYNQMLPLKLGGGIRYFLEVFVNTTKGYERALAMCYAACI